MRRTQVGLLLAGLVLCGCSDDGSSSEAAADPGASGATTAAASPTAKEKRKAKGNSGLQPGSRGAPTPEALMTAYLTALITRDCVTVVALTYYEPGGVSNAEDDRAQCEAGTPITSFEVGEVRPAELDPPPSGVEDTIAVIVRVEDPSGESQALDNPLVKVDGSWRMFRR